MVQYSYSLDIKFSNLEDAEFFYAETSNLIEWLSEYYDDSKVELPAFFNKEFNREELIGELLEEIEFWVDNDLPTVEFEDSVIIRTYTESFATFLSQIAEEFDLDEIELEEIISEEDGDMEMIFDDGDDYPSQNEDFYDDSSFSEFNDY